LIALNAYREQPTKFDLVTNLKTTHAFGLTSAAFIFARLAGLASCKGKITSPRYDLESQLRETGDWVLS
jgi:hypothetical protein